MNELEAIPINMLVMKWAGILRKDYGKREALKRAWIIAKAVVEEQEPGDIFFSELGICPECLTGAWIFGEGGNYKCLNCGQEFVLIKYQGVKL